ncbi:MAG: pyridoxal-phosphate dependent enzyme [Flavobacteriales bacterium]|nr:pyridoxal-phosphate dependent enzyme [Flavobacteriales bacterium]
MYYNNILETIGNTPLVKLNKVCSDLPCTVLAKVETFNPGNSIKDRMAVKMVEDAEKDGRLKPGGTIIEGTSGNTGMGLALAAIVKGYRLICVMPDKQSKEKMDMLRAVGAEVVVTPTNVDADDPRSYYSVSARLNREIPNSFYPNQYDNPSNVVAHYEQTGPEIWKQTEGKITHLVVGVGTGGTISGTGKYLKEQNPNIKIWGIDTYGSTLKAYHETGKIDEKEIYSYVTEGIGEDIIPKCIDFGIIDLFEKVTDKDGMIMTRELAKKEGIFVGNSAGCAIAGLNQLKDKLKPSDVVVVIFHDHGSRYVGKIFNDDWMRDRGFLDKDRISVLEVHGAKQRELMFAEADAPVNDVLKMITDNGISQLPVFENGKPVGSITEGKLFHHLFNKPEDRNCKVRDIMQAPFPEVSGSMSISEMAETFDKNTPAVLYKDGTGVYRILTKHDIIKALAD